MCLGYERDHIFVLSKEVRLSRPAAAETVRTTGGGQVLVSGRSNPIQPQAALTVPGNTSVSTLATPDPTVSHGSLPASLTPEIAFTVPGNTRSEHSGPRRIPRPVSARHAFRQQLLAIYYSIYLPADVIRNSSRLAPGQRTWLLQIAGLVDLTPALEAAVLATAAARVGFRDGDAPLLHQSLLQYARSLRELQRALRHPGLRAHDQTLAACMALAHYEFTEAPSGLVQGYFSHFRGAMELLRRRGPEIHMSGLGHGVLRALRIHSVSHTSVSLRRHAPTPHFRYAV